MDGNILLEVLDYLGIAVFAVTGALVASRKQLDIVAFCFFAITAGLGGGTLRDMMLGTLPVFWIGEPVYVVVAVAMAVLVFFTAHWFHETWSRYRLLLWADAVGLSAYAVLGSAKALAAGTGPIPAVLMGCITAAFGGVIRDVIAGEPSILVRPEVYITAAFAGATMFVILHEIGMPFWVAAIIGATVAFAVRAGALMFGWTLPPYRSRPGRDPDRT
jgi:uncharacterized membrane protein YeiH